MQGQSALPANEWYDRACRHYIEKHQGCPWCGGNHCLFRARRADRVEYSCAECDFFACHNHQTDCYYASPGHSSVSVEEAVR